MTPQEWKEVEKRLQLFYDVVKLKCDGYMVALTLERVNQFKNVIRIYIDGEIKGIWYTNECEQRRRFFRPIQKYANSLKHRTHLKKISKRMRQELGPLFDPDRKYTYYLPDWTSFSGLKRHLIKNNSNIELVKENEQGESNDESNR